MLIYAERYTMEVLEDGDVGFEMLRYKIRK